MPTSSSVSEPSPVPGIVVRWQTVADRPTASDLASLTVSDRERYETRTDHGAWTLAVVARALLRDTVAEVLGSDEVVDIAVSDDGAPHLPDHPDVRVSVAHTHGLAAVAVAEGRPVGIDVEALDRFAQRPPPELGHWLTAQERVGLPPVGPDRSTRLLELWTAKEAVLKAAWVGLRAPLRDLTVLDEEIRWSTADGRAMWWAVRWTTTATGHVIAVASSRA